MPARSDVWSEKFQSYHNLLVRPWESSSRVVAADDGTDVSMVQSPSTAESSPSTMTDSAVFDQNAPSGPRLLPAHDKDTVPRRDMYGMTYGTQAATAPTTHAYPNPVHGYQSQYQLYNPAQLPHMDNFGASPFGSQQPWADTSVNSPLVVQNSSGGYFAMPVAHFSGSATSTPSRQPKHGHDGSG